jgi:polar amino acid transport system substrate-binding protein
MNSFGNLSPRHSLVVLLGSMLFGCATVSSSPTPEVQRTLAPSGKLRVGLYLGGPSSAVRDRASGELKGVGYDLGRELARRLNVPFEPVLYQRNAEVLEDLKVGKVDVIFTNATPARAKEIDFSTPYLRIELGFLAAPASALKALSDIDKPGIRVAVLAGGTSDVTLSRQLKNATLVRARSIEDGVGLLRSAKTEVFAAQKSILFEMSDQLPGSRVLDSRFGIENHAIGIPKGRDDGLPFVQAFGRDAVSNGAVKAAVTRAGLRGTVDSAD